MSSCHGVSFFAVKGRRSCPTRSSGCGLLEMVDSEVPVTTLTTTTSFYGSEDVVTDRIDVDPKFGKQTLKLQRKVKKSITWKAPLCLALTGVLIGIPVAAIWIFVLFATGILLRLEVPPSFNKQPSVGGHPSSSREPFRGWKLLQDLCAGECLVWLM